MTSKLVKKCPERGSSSNKSYGISLNFTIDRFHHAEHINPCQLKLSFFEIFKSLLSDTYVIFLVTAATIFQLINNQSTNFVQNTIRNNHTKLHPNPFSSFREVFVQNVNDDGRQVKNCGHKFVFVLYALVPLQF